MITTSYPSRRQAALTLSILLLAYILSFVDRMILNLLIGPIRDDLAISDVQMSLLQGWAFALFYVTLGLPIGRLADRWNRKLIIAIGVVLWSLMTISCGLATSFLWLFLSRVGVGVGEAALSPAAYSMLSDSYPPAKLARATSIYTMGITIGGGLAYIVGGSVVELISTSDPIALPVLGVLSPWQLTFVIVGLPGFLVAGLLLLLTEPKRQRLARESASTPAPGIADVFAYLREHRAGYVPIFLSISILSILGYGYLNWYPAFLIRTYGASMGEVGREFGGVYLVFGTLGAISGALLSEQLRKRGHRDANLRTVAWVAVLLTLPAIVGPLMPTMSLALVVAAPTVFLLNAFFGVSIAALQVISPNRMRAVLSAMFLFATAITGLACGTTLVALLTQYVFQNDLALRYSLAVLAVFVCPTAALVAGRGLPAYRAALDRVA